MTRHLFNAVLISLALTGAVLAQPANLYENDGNVLVPPQIAPQVDATNFVNKGLFDINLPVTITQNGAIYTYFETWDTQNFTNRNTLSGSTGYRFDNFAGGPGGNGSRSMSANFVNLGNITVGLSTNTNVFNNFGLLLGTAEIIVSATNLTNSGSMVVGSDGLISLTGSNVNLTRGTTRIDNTIPTNAAFLGEFANPNAGIFDAFWGVGENTNQSFFIFGTNAFSGVEPVTTPNSATFQQVVASNYVGFANIDFFGDVQVVLLGNAGPTVTAEVRFQTNAFFGSGEPEIHWQGIVTNRNGTTVTNNLYLTDSGSFEFTNVFGLLTISGFFGVPPFAVQPTFAPFVYTFATVDSNYNLLPTNNSFSPSLIANPNPTNFYSIYGVNVLPVTAQAVANLPGSTISNLPGRIEISASGVLDLSRSIINGQNYLKLTAPKHYAGSTNAQINSPYYDINLASTNGNLSISNLVAPFAPHLNGTISVWGDDYTNVFSPLSNLVHVLIVSSALEAVSPVAVQNLILSSTNGNGAITISDIIDITNDLPFNVTNNVLLNAISLTTTTNDPFSPTDHGEINLFSSQIIWSGVTPRLSNLTNFGGISTSNSVYFAGSRQPPYYSTTFTEAYQSFVNHGFISVAGATVWANYFENSFSGQTNDTASVLLATNGLGIVTNAGVISCRSGPFTLQASDALMSNALIIAASDITLGSQNMVISNHVLRTGGTIAFNVTNLLTDTGTNSGNFWASGYGMSLTTKPAMGDLLGTTVTNFAGPNLEVPIVWAGEDRGSTVAGFLNDAAVGHLVLDGGDNASAFLFSGTGPQNAIYVDLIELKDGATNRGSKFDSGQIVPYYTAVDASPGMTVYFADAIADGQDISEKLNGNLTDSGGQVIWVPSYAGFFSSTNVTYPSGNTYSLNRALVESTDIDSNGNGIENAFDPAPVFENENVNLSLYFTNNPARMAVITWNTIANATNNLFTSTSLTGTNWSLVTNCVKNISCSVCVTNSTPGNGPRYYKVRVDPPQP